MGDTVGVNSNDEPDAAKTVPTTDAPGVPDGTADVSDAGAGGVSGTGAPVGVGVGRAVATSDTDGATNASDAPAPASGPADTAHAADSVGTAGTADTNAPDTVGTAGVTAADPDAADVGTTDTGDTAGTAPAPAPVPPTRRLFWSTLGIGLVLLLVDQASKWWAVGALGDSESIDVVGDVIRFWLVYNPGAAFSMGTGVTWVFTIFAGVAVVAIAWYAWRVVSTPWAYALGLLLGGATSHFGDRLFREPGFARGHVVDFIDYAGFFVGNVADIGIFAGAVTIVVLSFRGIEAVDRDPVDKPAG